MAKKQTTNSVVEDIRLKEDIASFKAMVAFIAFCLIIFFTATNIVYERGSMYMNIRFFIDKCPWIIAIFVGIFGLACLWKYNCSKNKKNESYRYFSSNDACGTTLFLLVYLLMLIVTYHTSVIIAVTVGFAVAYYVKHFYLRDFYIVSLFNIVASFMLWLVFGNPGTSGGISEIAKIGLAIIAACVIIYAVISALAIIRKKTGAQEKLTLVPAVISIVIAGILAVLCYTGTINILVAQIVLLIQYVGLGVFYTVRLLNQ